MTAGEADAVVAQLTNPPVALPIASGDPGEGGIPAEPGFYAWWIRRDALSSVPRSPHPGENEWGLVYVGIAPARASSSQLLRARVSGNHLRGNIGSSTFRLSLAALLVGELDLKPLKTSGSKVALTNEQNQALSLWQRKNLALTWATVHAPWTLEPAVIRALCPPLNITDNPGNPYGPTIRAARAALRASAAGPRS